jgi:hypothetical protein
MARWRCIGLASTPPSRLETWSNRLGRVEYETDAYRQFLIAPGTMITEQTRAWLADSGLFQRVVPAGSRIAPDYTLEGNVTALYGDFSDESAPAAVMEMRLFLLDNSGGTEKVAFAQTYHAATPVSDRTTEVFVEALNRSLVDILGRLESDLQREFSTKTVIAPVRSRNSAEAVLRGTGRRGDPFRGLVPPPKP